MRLLMPGTCTLERTRRTAMIRKFDCLVVAVAVVLVCRAPLFAQESFYKGKTIRVIVGASAGGGYDTYSRTIARHMGKHIAGNPTFVVENMPGAGFLISANHLYKIAKPDGLTIGHFNGNLFQLQAMGQKEIDFNAARFEYVGAVARVEIACGLSKASGIDSADKWLASKVAPRMGATAPGTGAYDTSRLLN